MGVSVSLLCGLSNLTDTRAHEKLRLTTLGLKKVVGPSLSLILSRPGRKKTNKKRKRDESYSERRSAER